MDKAPDVVLKAAKDTNPSFVQGSEMSGFASGPESCNTSTPMQNTGINEILRQVLDELEAMRKDRNKLQ